MIRRIFGSAKIRLDFTEMWLRLPYMRDVEQSCQKAPT